LLKGKTIGIDSTTLEANAAILANATTVPTLIFSPGPQGISKNSLI
jgi:hypothetical protein